jgi:hypothetical protein
MVMTHPDGDLLKLAEAALEYIDAIPKDIALPAMPGFDRDWANDVLSRHSASASTAGRGEVVAAPLEPTKEMALAGRKALSLVADRMETAKLTATSVIDFWQQVGHEPANEIYKAMLSASPPAAETATCKICGAGVGESCGTSPMQCATPADTSASVVGDREAIAQIIDPGPFWRKIPDVIWSSADNDRKKIALMKADKILALTSRGKADAGITKEMALAGRKALAIVADRMEEAKLLATSSIDFWQRVGHEPANEIYAAMVEASVVPSAHRGSEK